MSIDAKSILQPIITSRQLPSLVEELNAFWQEEQQRRADFYNWVTPDIKAEFINGEIVVHSPVRSKHNQVLQNVFLIIGTFVRKFDLGYVGLEKIMCRFERNDYEPDLCFFTKELSDEFRSDQTIFPVPTFVVEILSKSTEKNDRGIKLKDYEAHGVKEYWIIDAEKEVVEQYLQSAANRFDLKGSFSKNDTICSATISDLSFTTHAIFSTAENLKVLQQIAS